MKTATKAPSSIPAIMKAIRVMMKTRTLRWATRVTTPTSCASTKSNDSFGSSPYVPKRTSGSRATCGREDLNDRVVRRRHAHQHGLGLHADLHLGGRPRRVTVNLGLDGHNGTYHKLL